MTKLHMRTLAFIALLLTGGATLAFADPVKGLKSSQMAWFFNKPNASVETVLNDLKQCNIISQLAQGDAVDATENQYGLAGATLSIAWTGLLGPGRTNSDIASCMASRDYRRFEIIEKTQTSFTKQLETIEPAQLEAYLTSSTPPEGRLAAYEPNGLFYSEAHSLRASGVVPKLHPQQPLPSLLKFGGPLILNKKLPPKPIFSPSSLDASKATLVARLNFEGKAGRFDRPDLLFLKRDPETGHFVLNEKKRPTVFRIANHKNDKLVDGFQIFQIEPGQYVLWQVNGKKQSNVTYTCLSTLLVDFKAGDNIYLGDWTYTPANKYGVTANHQNEADIALKKVDRTAGPLRIAKYMNGADTPCTSVVGGGSPLYYFELP